MIWCGWGGGYKLALPTNDVRFRRATLIPLPQPTPPLSFFPHQGRARQFLYVISEATSAEAEAHFGPAGAGERAVLHCCAAGYHLAAAAAAGPAAAPRTAGAPGGGVRDAALAAAAAALASARRAAPDEPMVSVGLAQLAVARGNPADARRELERGVAKNAGSAKPSAAPHLALGGLLLPTDPAGAAAHFSRALRLIGGSESPGNVAAAQHARLGLGAAHYRAGRHAAARGAWERALDVASGGGYAPAAAAAAATPEAATDPATWAGVAVAAPAAMAGLAALDLAAPGAARRARGSARLAAAFAADPARPATLCLLSRQALVMGDTDRASALAKAAILAAGAGGAAAPLKAAAATAAARAHHAAGELLPALRAYRGASSVDAGAPLPILGLAQLTALQEGSVANAAATAERALERAPGWGAALRLLAPLYAHGAGAGRGGTGPGAAALPHFKAAAARAGAGVEDHEALGELLARRGDARGAAAAYRAALAAARGAAEGGGGGGGAPLPGRLLNNAAVSAFRVGDVHGAAALLDEALARDGAAGAAAPGALAPASALTVGYNRARVLEAASGPSAAAGEHTAIAAAFPGYADCQVRLSTLAAARGDLAGCAAAVEAALAADPTAADAPAVLGRALLSRRQWAASEDAFKRVDAAVAAGRAARAAAATAAGRPVDPADTPGAGPDPYAECGRAALFLHSAPSALSKRPGDAAKRAANLRRATVMFTRVLNAHPKCAAAAAGLAAAMAEAGAVDPARDVLLAVHEAASAAGGALEAPDAAVNLGHAHLAADRPGAAVRLYEAAGRAPPGPGGCGADPADRAAGLAVVLGRALYEDGKFADARRALSAGLRARPSDDLLRFNLAVVLETGGVRALRNPRPAGDPAALRCLEAGAGDVSLAARLFASLAATAPARRPPPGAGPPLEPARLAMHVAFCGEWASKAGPLLAAARLEAEARAARAAQSAAAHAASVKRAAVEAEVAAAESAAAREARQVAAREAAARLDTLRGQWAHNEAVAKAAEKGDAAAVDAARRAAKANAEADAVFEVGSDEDDREDYAPAGPGGEGEEEAGDDDSEMEDGAVVEEEEAEPAAGGSKRPAEEEAPAEEAAPTKRPRTALESDDDEDGAPGPPAVDAAALFGSDSE